MDELSCQNARIYIDALIDGELKGPAQAALQEHLQGCAECRVLLESRRQLVAKLQTLQEPALESGLRSRIMANLPAEPRRPAWQPALRWAAPLALAASLGLFFFMPRGNAVTDEMLSAHLRSLTPGHLIDVESSNSHVVKPWFNGKLALSPPVPDLAEEQFPLVGGRLDYVGDTTAACLIYLRARHVINLCLWPLGPNAPKPPASAERGGFHMIAFEVAGQQAVAVSDVNRPELEQFKQLWLARAQDPANNH